MRKVIVYDNRRPEKYDLFVHEMKRQGIEDYEIFHAVRLTHSVVESISESFKEVLKQAKENNEECICIFEDDIWFPNENGWKYFLQNKPNEFDVYIGGNYLTDNRLIYEAPLVRCNEWVGNHCLIINERYYDTWLNTDSKLHCDGAQSGLGDFYCCFPFPALQRHGFSLNHNLVVNYNASLPKEYIYS